MLCDRRTSYIDDLCVDIESRGRHIGRQLFDYVRRWAKQQSCQSITLNVWAGNDPALAFYRKAGMHIRKTCMELNLEPASARKEASAKPKTKVDSRVQKMVLVIGKQKLPRKQIMADLGLSRNSRQAFIDHYWKPACEQGLIGLAYPNSPNKPGQTYRLTANGLELYSLLTGKDWL